jgi:hypothetical protein
MILLGEVLETFKGAKELLLNKFDVQALDSIYLQIEQHL